MKDRIEKSIDLSASVERVWQALTDHRQFGDWFGVEIYQPFAEGKLSLGKSHCRGCKGTWEVMVVAIEPMRRFAFEWCPYEYDDARDFAAAPKTLVEFLIEPTRHGTRVTIAESGFASLPDDELRVKALRGNEEGWAMQAASLKAHVG